MYLLLRPLKSVCALISVSPLQFVCALVRMNIMHLVPGMVCGSCLLFIDDAQQFVYFLSGFGEYCVGSFILGVKTNPSSGDVRYDF